MAQREPRTLIQDSLSGTADVCAVLNSLFDRLTGQCVVSEGRLIDFKRSIDLQPQGAAEIARDVLGYANTEGGWLVIGVDDSGHVVGTAPIDIKTLRSAIGPYVGTRVIHECYNCTIHVRGTEMQVTVVAVPKSTAPQPFLLRRTIEEKGGFLRKVRYLEGSLFYRDGDETKVEPPGPDLDEVTQDLGFVATASRTRTSFVLAEDPTPSPVVRKYQR